MARPASPMSRLRGAARQVIHLNNIVADGRISFAGGHKRRKHKGKKHRHGRHRHGARHSAPGRIDGEGGGVGPRDKLEAELMRVGIPCPTDVRTLLGGGDHPMAVKRAVAAALLGGLLKRDVDDTHQGSELLDLSESNPWAGNGAGE